MKSLDRSRADHQVLMDQAAVSRNLRLMAGALEQAKKEQSPFDRPNAGQNGNGQGQQAGSGKKPPLVPPIAELKLLRGLQEAVYLETRSVDEGRQELTDSQRVTVLENLATQQADLNNLGQDLIRKLSNPE